MTEGDNDIHRDPQKVSKQLTARVRSHFVRISTNVTDFPIERPKEFKNRSFGKGGI